MRGISLLAITTASSYLIVACSSDSPGNGGTPDDGGMGGNAGGRATGGVSASGASGGGGAGGSTSGGKTGAGGAGGSARGGAGGTRDAGGADGSISDAALTHGSGGGGSTTDVAAADGSVADAGVRDAAELPDTGTGSGADAGPPVLRMRFVNVSPTTAPLDICMRDAGASTFTAQPLLRAKGVTSGLPYGSITDYFDLGTPRTLDFEFVEAGTQTCSPPIRGYVGNLAFTDPGSTTIAVYQYQFTPIDAYNPALLNAFGAPTPGPANVRVFDVVQPSFGAAAIDFYVTPPAGAEAKWFTNVPFGSGTAFHAAAAGAHSFRVTSYNTQTVLAQKSGVVLSTGGALDAFLFPTSATTFGLLRCPSTQTALVGVCAL